MNVFFCSSQIAFCCSSIVLVELRLRLWPRNTETSIIYMYLVIQAFYLDFYYGSPLCNLICCIVVLMESLFTSCAKEITLFFIKSVSLLFIKTFSIGNSLSCQGLQSFTCKNVSIGIRIHFYNLVCFLKQGHTMVVRTYLFRGTSCFHPDSSSYQAC